MFEHRWHILYYEYVPMWLWPAVWWQLWQIDRWTARFARQVFVEVDPDGQVYSVYWEGMEHEWNEDTGEVIHTGWRPSDLDPFLPNSPAWRFSTCPEGPYLSTALSPVHGLAKPDRNLLRRLCCASSLAGVKTQTSQSALLQIGLPPPVPRTTYT